MKISASARDQTAVAAVDVDIAAAGVSAAKTASGAPAPSGDRAWTAASSSLAALPVTTDERAGRWIAVPQAKRAIWRILFIASSAATL